MSLSQRKNTSHFVHLNSFGWTLSSWMIVLWCLQCSVWHVSIHMFCKLSGWEFDNARFLVVFDNVCTALLCSLSGWAFDNARFLSGWAFDNARFLVCRCLQERQPCKNARQLVVLLTTKGFQNIITEGSYCNNIHLDYLLCVYIYI